MPEQFVVPTVVSQSRLGYSLNQMKFRWLTIAALSGTLVYPVSFVSSEVTGNDLPDFGDSSGSLISPAQEMELGGAFMNSIRAQATLINDPQIDGYIRQLGDRLVANSDAPSYPFTFFVVKDSFYEP